MKRTLIGLGLICILLTGCAGGAAPGPSQSTGASVAPPVAATSVPPTYAPTPTPSPTPIPELQAITAGNVSGLKTALLIGRGPREDLQWLPDGNIAVLYATGLTVYTDFGVYVREAAPENHATASDSALNADGSRVAGLVNNRTVLIWNAQTGQIVQQMATNCALSTELNTHKVAFSNDGRRVAACDEGGVGVWDVDSGSRVISLKATNPVPSMIAFSPKGDKLIVSSSRKPDAYAQAGDIEVMDIGTGKVLQSYKTQSDFTVNPFAIHTGSNRLGISQTGKEVTVIDLDTLETVASYPVSWRMQGPQNALFSVGAIAFTPDGKAIALSSNYWAGTVVIDLTSGKQTRNYEHLAANAFKYSADGNLFAAGWVENSIYRTSSASHIGALGTFLAKTILDFDPGGRYIAVGGTQVALWDLVKGAPASTKIAPYGQMFAFVPGGTKLIANGWNGSDWDHALAVYDMNGGDHLIPDVMPQNVSVTPWSRMSSLRLGSSGTWAAVSVGGKYVQMIDLRSNTLGPKLDGPVTDLQFSPDGRVIAVAGGGIKFLDYRDGKIVSRIGLGSGLDSIAFSPDGKSIAGGVEGIGVQLWDVATGKAQALLAQNGGFQKVVFDPDGRRIAALAYRLDHMALYVWDVASGKLLYSREGTLGLGFMYWKDYRFAEIAFSPDGSLLVVKGLGENVEFLDAATGKTLNTLDDFKAIPVSYNYGPSIGFSANGHRFAVAGSDGIIRVFTVSQ